MSSKIADSNIGQKKSVKENNHLVHTYRNKRKEITLFCSYSVTKVGMARPPPNIPSKVDLAKKDLIVSIRGKIIPFFQFLGILNVFAQTFV